MKKQKHIWLQQINSAFSMEVSEKKKKKKKSIFFSVGFQPIRSELFCGYIPHVLKPQALTKVKVLKCIKV